MRKWLIKMLNRDPMVDTILTQIENGEWKAGKENSSYPNTLYTIDRNELKIWVANGKQQLSFYDGIGVDTDQFSDFQKYKLWNGGIKQLCTKIENGRKQKKIVPLSHYTKQLDEKYLPSVRE